MAETAGALILVASSDAALRTTLRAVLTAHGAEVVVADNGIDAIGELHDAAFDLAIVDVSLPPRGGREVLMLAKHLSDDAGVVMMVGRGDLEATVDCVRSGAFDFLAKPIAVAEIWPVASRAIEHRVLQKAANLYRASQAILEEADLQRLPTVLAGLATEMLACDEVCLIRRTVGGELYVAHGEGATRDSGHELLAIAEQLAHGDTERAPILLPDDAHRLPSLGWPTAGSKMRSVLLCPMIVGGRVAAILAGVRTVDPRPFRRTDAERAGMLAAQIRLALENAALLEKTAAGERLAAIGELSAGVAHEISNPVTYVLSNANHVLSELAQIVNAPQERLPGIVEELRDAMQDVREGAERIRDISHDLRTLARGSAASEVFDVSDAARSALRVTGATLRASANVVIDLCPEAFIRGSPGRLCQVFVNLLINAVQASAAMGPVQLFVTTERDEQLVRAVVRDTGRGIAPEHLSRIFDAFFTTKPSSTGTGLGLSITQSIVEAHGGRIEVSSKVGTGTTFTMSFPAAAPVSSRTCTMAPPRSRRTRMLFVDDDWSLLRAYERWFGRDNDVVTVQSGRLAIEILDRDRAFDVVVCDLAIDEVSGRDIFVRQLERAPDLASRFVFVTASAADASGFLSSSGRPVVEKPFAIAALRETLRRSAA